MVGDKKIPQAKFRGLAATAFSKILPARNAKNATNFALVSQILPQTNYSRYLANALKDCLVYTDRRAENLETELKDRVRPTFTRNSLKYPLEILKQARKDRVKLIHLQHEFNMFGTHPPSAVGFLTLPPLLRFFGFKVVTTIHGVVAPNQVDMKFLETFGWPAKQYWILPIKAFLSMLYFSTGIFSQKIIVHSPHLKKILTKKYKVRKDKIVVIRIGIPTLTESAIGNLPPKVKKPYLLYFGYFHRRKGLIDLIKAFKIVSGKRKGVRLVLAGGCLQRDFENQVKNLVTELGLKEKVIFPGFVELSTLRALLENCAVAVLPLSYSIAGSGPLAEVAAHHKPLVTTKIGVNARELAHKKNAVMVPPKDPPSLAKAVLEIMKDKALRERLRAGMRKMQKERSWDKIAQQTKRVYRDIYE